MKKKGFTLVELLAVIAILAILVIIALPNVMKLFNDAKKNSFTNELKEIYKAAQQEWMTESMTSANTIVYGRSSETVTTCITKSLSLSGRTQLQYGITVDSTGNVVKFVATDGTYSFNYVPTNTPPTPLTIEQIGKEDGADNLKVTASTTNNDAVGCNNTTNTVYELQ